MPNKATMEFTKEELNIIIDGVDSIRDGAIFSNYGISYEDFVDKLNNVFYSLDWTKKSQKK